MNQRVNLLASVGLAIGAVLGMTGSLTGDESLRIIFYEISSVGLTAACILLGVRYLREKNDLIASGFLLFGVAEAVMSSGTALGDMGGQASFGAGLALYVPAILLISLPARFPVLARITGSLAAIPFGIAAFKIFLGETVLSTSAFPGAGYGMLTLTIIVWIITLLKEKDATRLNLSTE